MLLRDINNFKFDHLVLREETVGCIRLEREAVRYGGT